MVASIGAIASPAQGAGYFERDGYYARDDPAHREASAWAGKGAEALGLSGPVDSGVFQAILEGKVPDGPHLGKRGKDGEIHHRPGRDVTMSAPKSVSLMAMIGGDERVVAAHDRAVRTTLGWIEKNAILARMQDGTTGAMIHADGQKTVVATFRHDTSRNLDPQLHTHCVIANMVQGDDGKWRTMVNDGLYRQQKAISAIYRAELAEGLARLGYGIERTHADGRFEVAGIDRETIEAFSTRRAEIEAAMKARGFDDPAENKRIADRAALMTRAAKRDVDKGALRQVWEKQAAALGFSPERVLDGAREREPETSTWGAASRESILAGNEYFATDAVNWAVAHLSERQAVFSHADLLASALSYEPGSATVGEAEWTVEALERDGRLHGAIGPEHGRHWATEAAVAREWETVGLMRAGKDAGERIMRRWVATTKLHRGRLNEGQKEAVKTVLSTRDRVVGVQGYAGTGKTAMLDRFRALAESAGFRVAGLAPSASAARTLGQESGIRSETLQRFLARHAGFGRAGHGAEPARYAQDPRENDIGGGRSLARLQRADAGPAADRHRAAPVPGGAGGRPATAPRWLMPAAPPAASRPPGCGCRNRSPPPTRNGRRMPGRRRGTGPPKRPRRARRRRTTRPRWCSAIHAFDGGGAIRPADGPRRYSGGVLRGRPLGGGRVRCEIGHDGGDEVADFLDLGLASGRDEVAGDGLCGEQRGPRDADFHLGAGPFAAVEGLHGELDEDLVGGMRCAPGGMFEAFPLLRSDPNVLVEGLLLGIWHRFLSTSVLNRAANGSKFRAVL